MRLARHDTSDRSGMAPAQPWHNSLSPIGPQLMTSPEQPPEASTTQGPVAPDAKIATHNPALSAAIYFCSALLLCVFAYLALTVPGSWFPSATARQWSARELALVRGSGGLLGDELVITAVDASGLALVSLSSNLRASDYASIAWLATDVPEAADVRVLWRNDYQPDKLNTAPITVEANTLSPVVLTSNPAWIGRVTGVALAIRGPLPQPMRVRAIVAKPMGAFEVLGDRAAEWLKFEGWTGTSINVVVGGSDVQDLPLPVLLAAVLLLAGCALLAMHRWRPQRMPARAAALVWLGVVVIAWFVLDARWSWNLLRQANATARTYAGKNLEEKHLAAEDGDLFAFIEKALAVMPATATPARVFVVSDARYFRERAAYLLYPHNVYTDRANGTMPPRGALRPGDWVIVYQRRGIQYDPAQHMLRWETGETIPADMKLAGNGNAVLLIR
jgi:hypothetical protein